MRRRLLQVGSHKIKMGSRFISDRHLAQCRINHLDQAFISVTFVKILINNEAEIILICAVLVIYSCGKNNVISKNKGKAALEDKIGSGRFS